MLEGNIKKKKDNIIWKEKKRIKGINNWKDLNWLRRCCKAGGGDSLLSKASVLSHHFTTSQINNYLLFYPFAPHGTYLSLSFLLFFRGQSCTSRQKLVNMFCGKWKKKKKLNYNFQLFSIHSMKKNVMFWIFQLCMLLN